MQQSGCTQTYPASGSYSLRTSPGKVFANVDYGNFRLGIITGMKFNDVNGNGVKDSKGHGIAGWTINLYDSSGHLMSSALTDSKGEYSFSNLKAGTYTIKELPHSGWTQSYPSSGSYLLTISSGKAYSSIDFGNHK